LVGFNTMKNFMPSIMVMMIYLIGTLILFLLLFNFTSVYVFFLYIGKAMVIYIVCCCFGYGSVYGVTKIIDKTQECRRKRFMWYYNMGLIESVLFSEPKYAKNYSKHYWMRLFK